MNELMTDVKLADVRKQVGGISQAEAARVLRVGKNTWNRWERGTQRPPPFVGAALVHVMKCRGIEPEQNGRRARAGRYAVDGLSSNIVKAWKALGLTGERIAAVTPKRSGHGAPLVLGVSRQRIHQLVTRGRVDDRCLLIESVKVAARASGMPEDVIEKETGKLR